MKRDPDMEWIRDLRDKSKAILQSVIPSHAAALLDIPTHMNVGDTMIWEGELSYLAALGIQIKYTSDIARFDKNLLDDLLPTGPILLHGGGNFGDVWPTFQRFREEIVANYPRRTIIQLPQTVRFSDEGGYARANSLFGRHRDFTLLVRDTKSLSDVKTYMPDVNVQYCPDMAFGLNVGEYPSSSSRTAQHDITVLGRTDPEKKVDLAGIGQFTTDWGLSGAQKLKWTASRIPGSLFRRTRSSVAQRALYTPLTRGYRTMRKLNLASGIETVQSGRLLVTDRLHAHILAGLLNKPHVVLDNNYGKIYSIYADYSGKFQSSHFARSRSEALMLVRALLTEVQDSEQ
ncbi:polysaccharide pyruvyl transferase family protein [Rhodococcus pyridinivorans]|uniref:polysaccharide pyruvyl transferase family protein n=1 Tax=Rhodococcus pyridinivorans TaxID=103816 RepID=UPI0037CC294E